MNGRLLMTVLESALHPRLKTTCAALASFADANGERIFPSLARVGWLIGKSERQVRSDVAALVGMGVLVEVTPRTGGRGRSTVYRLGVDALPQRPPFGAKPGCPPPGITAINPEADSRVLAFGRTENPEADSSKPGSGPHETRKPTAENPEAHFRRSVHDQELIVHEPSTARQTARFIDKAREPNGDNVRVVRRLAFELLDEDPTIEDPQRHSEFVEALKDRCAAALIDRGRHPDVPVHVVQDAVDFAIVVRSGNRRLKAMGVSS